VREHCYGCGTRDQRVGDKRGIREAKESVIGRTVTLALLLRYGTGKRDHYLFLSLLKLYQCGNALLT
jgi:hypothetical protein